MTTLSQSEYFILSRVDGMSSLDDIFAVSPLDEDETLRCIYGLVSAGVLVRKGGARAESASGNAGTAPKPSPPPPKPEPPAPPPKPRKRKAQAAEPPPRPAASSIRPPPSSPPAKAEVPPELGPSPEETAVRNEISQKHASLSDSNLYDLLGITITANEDEIKKAYYAMAKKYHPDRHHSPHLRDVHGLLEELFSKITHAYQTLSSTADRHRYDQTVKHGDSADASASAGDAHTAPKAEQASEAALKRQAEARYADGKHHFDEMHFFDAIQSLRDAVRLYPKKQYHKLLAQAPHEEPAVGQRRRKSTSAPRSRWTNSTPNAL